MASDEQRAQLLAQVSHEKADTQNLPTTTITIPQSVVDQFGNFGLFVAVHGPSWVQKFRTVSFYWNNVLSEIVLTGMENDTPTSELDIVKQWFEQELFTNTAELQQLYNDVQSFMHEGPSSAQKRNFEEGGDPQPAHPLANPAGNPYPHHDPLVSINAPQGQADGRSFHELYIPEDKVGVVIGGQGKTIKLLKDITNAVIQVEKIEPGQTNPNPQRKISISGTPEQIQKAEFEIKELLRLGGQTPPTGDDFVTEIVPIDSTCVGAIIGKQGDTIRLLQIKSHAHILTEKDSEVAPGCGTRKVFVTGTPEQVELARQAIHKLTAAYMDHQKNQGSNSFDPHFLLFEKSNVRTQEIKVDNEIIGLVIGRGGENIKQIHAKTKARISVDKNTTSPVRVITVTAQTEQSLRMAVELISTFAQQANMRRQAQQQQHSMGSVRPNNPRGQPQMDRQPQQSGMYGHQQQQRQPQAAMMYQQAQQLAALQSMGFQQIINPLTLQLQQAAAAASALGQPKTDGDVVVPPTVPADKVDLYKYYYNYYLKDYTPQQAMQYALHYVQNPQ